MVQTQFITAALLLAASLACEVRSTEEFFPEAKSAGPAHSRSTVNETDTYANELTTGDVILRIETLGDLELREQLTVIGRSGSTIYTSCPRTPRGQVYRSADSAPLPYKWELSPDGSCAILGPLAVTTAN